MKEQARGRGLSSSPECGGAERAAGYGLQEPLEGDALGFNQGRGGGEVESTGDQTCQGYDFKGCREVLRGCVLGP
jgi:hypothetical protein